MSQKQAAYNSTGDITAYYDATFSPPPDGVLTINITDAEYQKCMTTPGYTVANGVLVAPATPTAAETLATAQSKQAAAINVACQAAIAAGFTSSTLGSAYTYPSDDKSQLNIAMAVPNGGSLWCATGSTWAMVSHTAAQAAQVQKDLFAMIQDAQTKYADLLTQIKAATTVAAVQAIVWG